MSEESGEKMSGAPPRDERGRIRLSQLSHGAG